MKDQEKRERVRVDVNTIMHEVAAHRMSIGVGERQILSIKGLVIVSDNQKLPKFPPDSELHPYGKAYVRGGRAYIQTLIKAGFKRVIE